MLLYFRFLRRNKVLTVINMTGLALGISSCLFITIFVTDELSYDASNENVDRIYRITSEIVSEGSVDHVPTAPSPLARTLEHDFNGIDKVVRINMENMSQPVKINEQVISENHVYKADRDIFKVFTYPFIAGDPTTALGQPNSVVLTESMAKKYFGSIDILGKTLTIGKRDHIVNGIMQDVPLNSDLKVQILTSMDSINNKDDWFDFGYGTYVLFDKAAITNKAFLADFNKRLSALNDDKVNRLIHESNQHFRVNLHLQPLKGLHFAKPLLYDTPKGNIYYTYIFSIVAVLILFIGCLNFINFSIIQSIERSREVGIRKVVGASFNQLVLRYVGESFVFTFSSFVTALAIVFLMMPFFNTVTERSFTMADLLNPFIFSSMIIIFVFVGVLAGSYPAFYTSSIKPVNALKGRVTTPKGQFIRKMSVGAQFFVSIGLIICTAIVYSQMAFIHGYDLGFKKDNTIVINTPVDSTNGSRIKSLVQKIGQHRDIGSVVMAGWGSIPGGKNEDMQRGTVTLKTDGRKEVRMLNNTYIDENYIPVMGIQLAQGRNYNGSISDFQNSIIVNESLVKMMGWKEPLSQQIVWNGKDRKVIGVIRDFYYMSLYNNVEPQILVYHENNISCLFLRISSSDREVLLTDLKQSWNGVFPDEPLIYRFLDESIETQYERESKAITVFSYFSILTILISCLGLFGLSSLTVYQRRKEIGIRRVIGADLMSIIFLFTKEYILLIVISLIAVSPVAWYVMRNWLETFPHRQSINVFIFVLAGSLVLVISFLTVSFSLIRIAVRQPVSLIEDS